MCMLVAPWSFMLYLSSLIICMFLLYLRTTDVLVICSIHYYSPMLIYLLFALKSKALHQVAAFKHVPVQTLTKYPSFIVSYIYYLSVYFTIQRALWHLLLRLCAVV